MAKWLFGYVYLLQQEHRRQKISSSTLRETVYHNSDIRRNPLTENIIQVLYFDSTVYVK